MPSGSRSVTPSRRRAVYSVQAGAALPCSGPPRSRWRCRPLQHGIGRHADWSGWLAHPRVACRTCRPLQRGMARQVERSSPGRPVRRWPSLRLHGGRWVPFRIGSRSQPVHGSGTSRVPAPRRAAGGSGITAWPIAQRIGADGLRGLLTCPGSQPTCHSRGLRVWHPPPRLGPHGLLQAAVERAAIASRPATSCPFRLHPPALAVGPTTLLTPSALDASECVGH